MPEKRALSDATPDMEESGVDVDQHTENINRKMKKSKHSKPMRLCGVIASVEVTNFMSHGHFKIELGPKINYITGHNGSGKSAVLTALTVCLGARANTTNRSSSLKGFIKHGKKRADVLVAFHNCNDPNTGLDAYEHETHGDLITIHRTISLTGPGSLKIKNEIGKTVGTKREDLMKILDHYCYQIGNPLSILNQETARTFLGRTDAKELYGLYAKGVKYEQLGHDYDLMLENMTQSVQDLKKSKDGVKAAKEEVRKSKEVYDKCEQYRDIVNNIHRMKSKIAWASVEDGKTQISHAEKDIEDLKIKRDNVIIAGEEAHTAFDKTEEVVRKLKHEQQEKIKLCDLYNEGYNKKKEELQKLRSKCEYLSVDQRKMKENIRTLKEHDDDYSQKIEQCERLLLESNDSLNKKYQLEIDQLTLKKKEINAKTVEIERQEIQEKEKIDKTTEMIVTLNKSIEKLRNQKEEIESEISNLKSIKKDDFMSRFLSNTGKILEIIKAEKKFHKTPYGPLGSYITLKNEKWRLLLDTLYSRQFSSFAVETEEDKVLLNSIFTKHNYRADVIKRSKDNFDYQSGLPDSRFTTILDVLSFSDDYVKRLFIDFNRIESLILVNDRAEGDREMYKNPKNVKSAYACSSDSRSYYKIGGEIAGSSTSSSKRMAYSGVSKMKSLSNDGHIEQNLLKKAEIKYQEVKTLFNEKLNCRGPLELVINKSKELLENNASEYRAYKNKIRLLNQKIEDLNIRLTDNLDTNIIARIDSYKEERETTRTGLKRMCSDLASLDEEIGSCNQELGFYEGEIQILKEKLEAASITASDSQQELRRLEEEITFRNLHIVHHEQRVKKIIDEIIEKQNSIQEMQKQVTDLEVDVRNIYPEVIPLDSGESITILEGNIKGLQDLATRRNELSDISKASSDFNASIERLNEALALRMDKKRIHAELIPLKEAHSQRVEVLERKKESDKLKLSLTFSQILSIRNMAGSITLDTENKLLITNVQPNRAMMENSNGVVLDNRSLSGGEKSFTQISLLLSVWELMQSRFYALDEFDVFMDPVNRKMSIQVLVDAIKKKDCQVILITPQAMSEAKLGNDVKIHKIADPRRQAL
ncbi:P-loop containing nucleoside triphosphate hydrolase protein [Nadsonia fulvescens var. elongata DSM 6958]|uniref:p-loop containing nucleoside triphosphate hydrolase protein n=1 Tax=Nadsonia fulvescens var. elongata DSM 6958 TaxID=857566 RepID=A0A1E3PEY4_9ASCO|nr:P-loop containing nucleoside triphosphate hydrolase protein [Nadsonia fulvescens var. elongata DSM 6958]